MCAQEFFWHVYGNQPQVKRPPLLALSATFPTSYIRLLSTLLSVDLSIGHCIRQGTPIKFCQQEINMQLENPGAFDDIVKEIKCECDFKNVNIIIF